MNYFIWSLPILTVLAAMLSGRIGSVGAGMLGAILTALAIQISPPKPFPAMEILSATETGLWLAALIGAVIYGGLFFREVVAAPRDEDEKPELPPHGARAECFFACFLVGPFTETATGVGVGQVAAVGVLQRLNLPPQHIAGLALFSQMLVPWGAMATGTLVGATFSGIPATVLGQHSAVLTLPLLAAWLPLFWLFARRAGINAGLKSHLLELAWTVTLAISLVVSSTVFDPQVAGLAALGPLLALWLAGKAFMRRNHSGLSRALPYVALVIGLVVSHAGYLQRFADHLVFKPFPNAPGWNVLMHPSTWLIGIGILTAVILGRSRCVVAAGCKAWSQGRKAIVTVCLFLVMAQLMTRSGMTAALAFALHDRLGLLTTLVTPLTAGIFGFLTGTSNAANGLIMTAQVSFAAEAHLDVAWVAAVQNTASAALTMLSPVRLTMGCALAGCAGSERSVYARYWALGASAIAVLTAVCALFVFHGAGR